MIKKKQEFLRDCNFITTMHNMLDKLKKQNKIIVWVEENLSFFDKITGTKIIKFMAEEPVMQYLTYEMIKRKNPITRKVSFEIRILEELSDRRTYFSKNNQTENLASLFWEALLEETNKWEKKLVERIKEQKKYLASLNLREGERLK
jgi:hypothetical protein